MTEHEINEIETKIAELTALKNELKNEEQAIKLTMNSIYGAIGNNYFACFNSDVAEAVTLQGQDLIKYSEKIVFRYFSEFWDKDTELHEKLGITSARRITSPMTIYGDTDSTPSDTILYIKDQENLEKIRFDDCFNTYSKISDITTDDRGNEIIKPLNLKILNYKDQLVLSGVRKIIRHKVNKPKWRIKSESGKEIIVTNDHSVIIFRNGVKLAIKPSEINIETDKILSVYLNI